MLELRGGGASKPDAVPPVRPSRSRVRPSEGREDIEAAVAASGLKLGDRVVLAGAITFLSADARGAVWMRVRLDGERGSHVDCWSSDLVTP